MCFGEQMLFEIKPYVQAGNMIRSKLLQILFLKQCAKNFRNTWNQMYLNFSFHSLRAILGLQSSAKNCNKQVSGLIPRDSFIRKEQDIYSILFLTSKACLNFSHIFSDSSVQLLQDWWLLDRDLSNTGCTVMYRCFRYNVVVTCTIVLY